ncbi:MAG: ribonuclease H-like domain-containing protein [Anaerolineales bacterium]|nr:ribonuclease H-like domain-containing protein [Anaerolineales bacterium]
MPSLSDRLKALGVSVGTNNLTPDRKKPGPHFPIESVLAGEWRATRHGEIFVVETHYPLTYRCGQVPLRGQASLQGIAAWAKQPEIAELPLEQFAFLDTETTGLAGGTGTYTFLVGLGRFEGHHFRLAQFFLREPSEEPAQLAAIEEFLHPCRALVSFNGKSFDLPLLNNRYILNGWPPVFQDNAHLDLLHLARKLWRARLPSRALGDLETHILGATRSQQDVPGWMVADLYFDYLHSGDARPLSGVFYHNEMDVVALAALLNHMAALLDNPLQEENQHALDLVSIGKLYAELEQLELAIQIYQRGLQSNQLESKSYWQAIEELSFIHKKRGEWQAAMQLWEQAAAAGQIYAQIELAKVFEHQQRDCELALQFTQAALAIVTGPEYPSYETARWQPELAHRQARLLRKIEACNRMK